MLSLKPWKSDYYKKKNIIIKNIFCHLSLSVLWYLRTENSNSIFTDLYKKTISEDFNENKIRLIFFFF